MSASEIHILDRGTTLRVTVKDGTKTVVLSASTADFIFTKPPSHGTNYIKSATIANEVGGIVSYTFESGFLDTVGTWQYQVRVTSGTSQWHSDINKFIVYRNA